MDASDENKINDLPQSAQDFIKLVIKKMRYRRKVRRDVKAELIAHFEDELAGCTDEQQRDRKVKELIEQFGDAKLLGILLRRAKKRCRPLWRTVVARTFQTIGVLILCLIIYVAWFLSGKPVITTNYVEVMNEAAKPFADAGPNLNAAPFYEKAAEELEKMEEDKQIPKEIDELFGTKYADLTSEQKELIDQWLKENNHLLELLEQGANLPYYWPTYQTGKGKDATEAINVLMPHLASYRKFARMLVYWQAEKKAQQGLYQQAFDDVLICYKMGRHLKGNTTLIEQLVGNAVEALAIMKISGILSHYEIDSALLAKLQTDFEKLIADEDFTIKFEQEKYFLYDEIQRSFTVDRIGGGHLYLKRVSHIGSLLGTKPERNKFKYLIRLLFFHPDKQQTLDTATRYYDHITYLSSITPYKQKIENIDTEKEIEQSCKGNMFLEVLAPAFSRVIELGYRARAQVQATPLIIAVHRYNKDFGCLPDNLNKLEKAGYIKKLPVDPYADSPLKYQKTDDGFTVYSMGLNFVDDNGQIYIDDRGKEQRYSTKEGGDMVFWPVQK